MATEFGYLRAHRFSIQERFAAKYIPEPNSGCWIWIAHITSQGYGLMRMDGRNTTAHRISWLLSGREIPPAMEIDHKCRNRSCVNPDHLQVVTKAENLRHRTKIRDICWRGHPLKGENLIIEKSGIRRCRICRTTSRNSYRTGKQR